MQTARIADNVAVEENLPVDFATFIIFTNVQALTKKDQKVMHRAYLLYYTKPQKRPELGILPNALCSAEMRRKIQEIPEKYKIPTSIALTTSIGSGTGKAKAAAKARKWMMPSLHSFPVTFALFKKCVNLNATVAQLLTDFAAATHINEITNGPECLARDYYHLYYMHPAIRDKYPLQINACPNRIKALLLTQPSCTYEPTMTTPLLGDLFPTLHSFPVTLQEFSHHAVNLDEILHKILKDCCPEHNERLSKQPDLLEHLKCDFYHLFYMQPAIREEYGLRLKACPSSIRAKIFALTDDGSSNNMPATAEQTSRAAVMDSAPAASASEKNGETRPELVPEEDLPVDYSTFENYTNLANAVEKRLKIDKPKKAQCSKYRERVMRRTYQLWYTQPQNRYFARIKCLKSCPKAMRLKILAVPDAYKHLLTENETQHQLVTPEPSTTLDAANKANTTRRKRPATSTADSPPKRNNVVAQMTTSLVPSPPPSPVTASVETQPNTAVAQRAEQSAIVSIGRVRPLNRFIFHRILKRIRLKQNCNTAFQEVWSRFEQHLQAENTNAHIATPSRESQAEERERDMANDSPTTCMRASSSPSPVRWQPAEPNESAALAAARQMLRMEHATIDATPTAAAQVTESCSSRSTIADLVETIADNLQVAKTNLYRGVPLQYRLPYVLRFSGGLKRIIWRGISRMSFDRFYYYTRYYGMEDGGSATASMLAICFECAITDGLVWPVDLYMPLEQLVEFLHEFFAGVQFALADISPKLLHWSDLCAATDFDDCVHLDYVKMFGDSPVSAEQLQAHRALYYDKCWRHDEWLWRVPAINIKLSRTSSEETVVNADMQRKSKTANAACEMPVAGMASPQIVQSDAAAIVTAGMPSSAEAACGEAEPASSFVMMPSTQDQFDACQLDANASFSIDPLLCQHTTHADLKEERLLEQLLSAMCDEDDVASGAPTIDNEPIVIHDDDDDDYSLPTESLHALLASGDSITPLSSQHSGNKVQQQLTTAQSGADSAMPSGAVTTRPTLTLPTFAEMTKSLPHYRPWEAATKAKAKTKTAPKGHADFVTQLAHPFRQLPIAIQAAAKASAVNHKATNGTASNNVA